MNKPLARLVAAAALVFGLAPGPAFAQEPQPPSRDEPVSLPATFSITMEPRPACSADDYALQPRVVLAVDSVAATFAGKVDLTQRDENGKIKPQLTVTDEARAALQADLNEFWRSVTPELTVADVPNPAPEGFDYTRLKAALFAHRNEFTAKASRDFGAPLAMVDFKIKIPAPNCAALLASRANPQPPSPP